LASQIQPSGESADADVRAMPTAGFNHTSVRTHQSLVIVMAGKVHIVKQVVRTDEEHVDAIDRSHLIHCFECRYGLAHYRDESRFVQQCVCLRRRDGQIVQLYRRTGGRLSLWARTTLRIPPPGIGCLEATAGVSRRVA
jgi:hypothetical protein